MLYGFVGEMAEVCKVLGHVAVNQDVVQPREPCKGRRVGVMRWQGCSKQRRQHGTWFGVMAGHAALRNLQENCNHML